MGDRVVQVVRIAMTRDNRPALVLTSVTASLLTAQTSTQRRTVWDGVYTEAQAAGTAADAPVAGGAEGIDVTAVNRVAQHCP